MLRFSRDIDSKKVVPALISSELSSVNASRALHALHLWQPCKLQRAYRDYAVKERVLPGPAASCESILQHTGAAVRVNIRTVYTAYN